ncbi:non-homologous end-joining DNA ligase [Rhizobium ruizarguesonis]|uniref:non-homologous end-joining DNA ligase n=1 Tax=Rhizobium ruizarguesonis TaxID=2081791 RepID=UPI000413108A|nr:non-homologous end-joining DNA ligase [Rhizobium ruizarguesonis]QJS29300.1 ATP-dependent DNA ligase [Rhizobium leguminosarum bv. trifolii TA1]UFW93459.1 non-homologous end-joining DNA ligase [Rhizobium ruizarguesonis]
MAKLPRSPPRSKPLLRDESGQLQSRPIRKRNPAQPQLLFDPMPDRVEPALAALKTRAPAGNFGWEIKWDGYRLAVHIEPNGVRLLTRGGYDWVDRFPAIAEAARELGPTAMILDGEAVMLDEQGRSDFNLLQASLGADGRKSGNLTSPAILYAFDILYLDGHDLRGLDYQERRHLLEDALAGHEGAIRLSEEVDADPYALLEHACRLGVEGIVGKNRDSKYRSGRTGDWVKLKCVQSESFVIVGYEPSNGAFGGFASLLLAAYKGIDLVYVGSVGTGFKEAQSVQLRKMMEKLHWKRKQPPVPYSGKRQVMWLQPTLIAEVEYRAWTNDGKLRHSAYKGLRKVQDNADVYRIEDRDGDAWLVSG